MEEPKFDLKDVFQIIKEGEPQDIVFSFGKALDPVKTEFAKTTTEAKDFILEQIQRLSIDNFAERVLINGVVYDVYGKNIADISWYIKFSVISDENGEFLYAISFHPIKNNLVTRIEELVPN